jgi:uncharacterized protein (TIGR02466 family)
MRGNIVPIFPKSYYVRDNVCSDLIFHFQNKIKKLSNKTARSGNFNVDSSYNFQHKLFNINPFDILSDEIMVSVREYMSAYGYSHERIPQAYIQTMWFNISNKGDFLFPHIHPGSFISGAYYIKTSQENNILFHDENKNIYEDPEKINEFNTTINSVPCIPGRLLLFSSDLQHSTLMQINEGEKIVVSFNIILENRRD